MSKTRSDTGDSRVRLAYGRLAGAAGLTANIFLFLLKLAAGLLAGSLAVMADAFNNLSDAGSSVVTLVGFKLSAAPPGSGASLWAWTDGIFVHTGGGRVDYRGLVSNW